MRTGPPATPVDGTALFQSLLSFSEGDSSDTPLQAVAQLLQAGLSLEEFKNSASSDQQVCIICVPGLTLNVDLAQVCERKSVESLQGASFLIYSDIFQSDVQHAFTHDSWLRTLAFHHSNCALLRFVSLLFDQNYLRLPNQIWLQKLRQVFDAQCNMLDHPAVKTTFPVLSKLAC